MEYLEALGQTLREIRVAAGLSREDCSRVMNRDYLASIERGQQAISILKFKSLCECLAITPSLVLLTVEARLVGQGLESYLASQEPQFNGHVMADKLHGEANGRASQGVRGKRAEDNRKAIQSLRSEGLTKAEIVRKLGVGRTTVDRYWNKANT
ncbi:helix-turn-helix domain-containing protein [Pseudomonas sp. SED1]|uniref:helix-turn-helix domain-containing protein n=1 Tax=Pseudomonas sp. SED1 TaxID=3056845 RepID=UPI00296F3D38|nr:helix-turn-helix domain-containing protein [Pseudomonas sp. SED1]MDY0834187.1 helix-turn-helix domain-containing protein [Pseudomonas sp. SED1]